MWIEDWAMDNRYLIVIAMVMFCYALISLNKKKGGKLTGGSDYWGEKNLIKKRSIIMNSLMTMREGITPKNLWSRVRDNVHRADEKDPSGAMGGDLYYILAVTKNVGLVPLLTFRAVKEVPQIIAEIKAGEISLGELFPRDLAPAGYQNVTLAELEELAAWLRENYALGEKEEEGQNE